MPRHARLTPREKEVLALLVSGKTNKEIAETLDIGVRTAQFHVENIKWKFLVGSRVRVAVLYIKGEVLVD